MDSVWAVIKNGKLQGTTLIYLGYDFLKLKDTGNMGIDMDSC
jgi:hypothetical protein